MSASTQTVAMIGIAGRTNSDEFSAGQPWYSFSAPTMPSQPPFEANGKKTLVRPIRARVTRKTPGSGRVQWVSAVATSVRWGAMIGIAIQSNRRRP